MAQFNKKLVAIRRVKDQREIVIDAADGGVEELGFADENYFAAKRGV